MKFKQEKVKKGKRFTDWIRPTMNGYHISCCDCGLVHTLNFRALKIIKITKKGTKIGKILPKDKYQIEFKISRNNKLTKQQRKRP